MAATRTYRAMDLETSMVAATVTTKAPTAADFDGHESCEICDIQDDGSENSRLD